LRKFNLEFLQDGSKYVNEMHLDKALVWEIPNTAIFIWALMEIVGFSYCDIAIYFVAQASYVVPRCTYTRMTCNDK